MLRWVADLTKRRLRASLALFLCLAFSACDPPGDAPAMAAADVGSTCASPPADTLRRVAVASVYDGDTLRLRGGERLRLVGVNTPERGRDGQPSEPLAEAAREALAALTEGGYLWLQQGAEPRDRHGRLLAYAFDAQGRSIAAQLLRSGLGFHVAIAPNTRYADCLAAAETVARNGAVGVWAEAQFRPRPVRSLSSGEGGFRLIRDRVTRVSFKDNGWWLQLGGQLGVKIGADLQPRYSRPQLAALQGREVEVRGWLVPRDGGWWTLTLGHPLMLDIRP